jgi:hypothetical protein
MPDGNGVIGYRVWRAVPVAGPGGAGPHWELHSITPGHGAWESALMQAECKARGVTSSHLHRVPNVSCKCGIYSTYTVMGALEQVLNTKGPYILGAVVNYQNDTGNDLLLHDGWIRSPEAEIVALARLGSAFEPASRVVQIDGQIDGMTEFVDGGFGQEIATQFGLPVVAVEGLETFAHEHGQSVAVREIAGQSGAERMYIDDLRPEMIGSISQHALSVDRDGRMYLSSDYSLLRGSAAANAGYPLPFNITRAANGRLIVEALTDIDFPHSSPVRTVLVHETDGRLEHERGNPAFAHPVDEFLMWGRPVGGGGETAIFPASSRRHLLDFLPHNRLRRVNLDYHVFPGGQCALPRFWSEPWAQSKLPGMEIERTADGWGLHLPASVARRKPGSDFGLLGSPANIHEHAVTELRVEGKLIAADANGVRMPQRYLEG